MRKLILSVLAALALSATAVPARAGCYEHCHTDSYGDTTCHWNCY